MNPGRNREDYKALRKRSQTCGGPKFQAKNPNDKKIDQVGSANQSLGNAGPKDIEQIGELPDSFRQDFEIIPLFQHLKQLSG
jgi:hypothetical protein